VDDTSLGNWTWLELAIFEDESSDKPRTKDSVELVWLSHKNRFLTDEYGWVFYPQFSKLKEDIPNERKIYRWLAKSLVVITTS
jgi:hypothetical protein